MTEREAQEIVRMVESNWQMDLSVARGIWRDGLVKYEVDVVMKAVAYLATTVHRRLKFADLVDTIKMFLQREEEAALAALERTAVEPPRSVYETPEWVWVWVWARNYRDPAEERSFPQMIDYADPRNTMTAADYEALREEWVAAGSIKERPKNLVRTV